MKDLPLAVIHHALSAFISTGTATFLRQVLFRAFGLLESFFRLCRLFLQGFDVVSKILLFLLGYSPFRHQGG